MAKKHVKRYSVLLVICKLKPKGDIISHPLRFLQSKNKSKVENNCRSECGESEPPQIAGGNAQSSSHCGKLFSIHGMYTVAKKWKQQAKHPSTDGMDKPNKKYTYNKNFFSYKN